MTEQDPITNGVPIRIISGDGTLGASIDALKTSVDALKASIDAAFPH
jgi:hypothetical protein